MVSFWFRSLLRLRKLVIVGVFVGVMIIAFSYALNQVVYRFIPAFTALEADRLKLRIAYTRIQYVFPRQIIINSVDVFDRTTGLLMARIPELRLTFAFPILTEEPIRLVKVAPYGMMVRVPAVRQYTLQNSALLWKELASWPQRNIQIALTDARMYLLLESQLQEPLIFGMEFSYQDGQFKGKYHDRQSFVQFWGNANSDEAVAQGYMFYSGPLAPKPMYILDLKAHVSLKGNNFLLRQLSFSINQDQVLATGQLSLQEMFDWQVQLFYRRSAKVLSAQDPLKMFLVNARGQGRMIQKGNVTVDLLATAKMPLEQVRLNFQEIKPSLLNDQLLILEAQNARLDLKAFGRSHVVPLDRILAGIKHEEAGRYSAVLSSQLLGGQYRGQVSADLNRMPWQFETQGNLEGLEVSRFAHIMPSFKECSGYLSGHFQGEGPQGLSLKGTLVLQELDFSKAALTPRLSKLLQMPSLERLSKSTVSLKFHFDPQAANLEDFHFYSKDVSLNGSFKFKANQTMTSRISLMLSQELWNEMPVGKQMIRLVPQAWLLPLELQLSGNMERMNFQWKDSILKRKVEHRLPDFIERMIDRRVEAQMAV